MGFELLKQAEERLVNTVASTDTDSTLAVGNRTDAYRKANLSDQSLRLQTFTQGLFLSVSCDAAGQTGTLELWGYPMNGSAEYLGEFTYTAGQQTAEDGGYYVDAFIRSEDGLHTVTILNVNDCKALLKLDSLGYKYFAVLGTNVDTGTHRYYLRPW